MNIRIFAIIIVLITKTFQDDYDVDWDACHKSVINAALPGNESNHYYIFSDHYYWSINYQTKQTEGPFISKSKWKFLKEPVESAFSFYNVYVLYAYNGVASKRPKIDIFFTRNNEYVYDESLNNWIEFGSHKDIISENPDNYTFSVDPNNVLAAFELPDYKFEDIKGKKQFRTGDAMLLTDIDFNIIHSNPETYKSFAFVNYKSKTIIENNRLLFLDPKTYKKDWLKNKDLDEYKYIETNMSISSAVTVNKKTILFSGNQYCIIEFGTSLECELRDYCEIIDCKIFDMCKAVSMYTSFKAFHRSTDYTLIICIAVLILIVVIILAITGILSYISKHSNAGEEHSQSEKTRSSDYEKLHSLT